MKERLVIDLASLPEEGRVECGELSAEIFDLPGEDAVPLSALSYDFFIKRFESELLLTGRISAKFQFTCVRTLHAFEQTIELEDAAISLEIGQSAEMDATDAVREELLLAFPVNPKCEDGDEPGECKIEDRYLSVDKPPSDELTTPPRDGGDDRWSALDRLRNLKDPS